MTQTPPGTERTNGGFESKVLVLLHDEDYWNYFSISEERARERWPAAHVVGGLHYGVSTELYGGFTYLKMRVRLRTARSCAMLIALLLQDFVGIHDQCSTDIIRAFYSEGAVSRSAATIGFSSD